MKTIIREMVETIKQLFAQKQQMQEPVVANYEVSGIVEQKTLKKKEELEKAGDNVGILLRGTKRDEVERGQVLAHPGTITPRSVIRQVPYF